MGQMASTSLATARVLPTLPRLRPLPPNPPPGPAGASVREIMRRTGADIKSWTEAHGKQSRRPARIFLIGVSL